MARLHDKIGTRLAMILTRFNDGDSFSIDELAVEFGVSYRTIYRDINERLVFLPIEKKHDRYSLAPYYLGKLSFKDINNFASISGIAELYPSLDREFVVDLLNTKVNHAFMVKASKYEDISENTQLFTDINIAIVKNQTINFTYKDKPRTVNPYKLVNTYGIWYLSADEDGTLKTYSFTKIKNFKNTQKIFKPNKKFVDIIEQDAAVWFSQNRVEVHLKVDISVAEYFDRRQLLPHQTIVAKHTDHYEISAVFSYKAEAIKFVRYWIPHIEILSPVTLQQELNAQLDKYTKQSRLELKL